MLNKRADKLELLRIAEAVALEKSIDKELIIGSMENGIAKAAKSKFGSENEIKVEIDRESGDIGIFRKLVIKWAPETLLFTEMINATSLKHGYGTQKIKQLELEKGPIGVQIFDNRPFAVSEAAKLAGIQVHF